MRELTLPRSGGVTAALFAAWGAGDPHRPRLVWHGQGRTELSAASLTNWSAKTAGYLVDELGAGPGDRVLWRVHRSWQGLPLLLGCWWAGLVVTEDDALADDVVTAFVDAGDEAGVDSIADEVVVASAHPFGLAVPDLAARYRNVADAILPQADRFAPRSDGPGADAPAMVTAAGALTVRDVLDRVARSAAAIGEGAVLLSGAAPDLPGGVCAGALAVWAAGGTLVQIGPDAGLASGGIERVAADERATVTLGSDVHGRPRVG